MTTDHLFGFFIFWLWSSACVWSGFVFGKRAGWHEFADEWDPKLKAMEAFYEAGNNLSRRAAEAVARSEQDAPGQFAADVMGRPEQSGNVGSL
jgi:hypothetical protein